MAETPKKREREVEHSERMSDHEALMWNVEKDPWLNPNGGSITLLDRPVDMERFRRQLRAGIAKIPRLYERVVPGFARLSTPAWAPDPEFDLDYHLREMDLGGNATERELFDLAAQLYNEPLDRTRPLWRFVCISGLEGGRGAIYALIHHVVSDGIGQLRMAEMYQQLTRDDPGPDDVDLEGIVAEAVANHEAKEAGGNVASSLVDTLQHTLGHLVRRQAGIGRRIAGELVLWPADPSRATDVVDNLTTTVRSAAGMLAPGDEEVSGSPIWKNRSRHRHLEYVRVPVDDLKTAGRSVGGTVNDAFLAGLAEAAHRYHEDRGAPTPSFNSSFVISTRTDSKIGGNAFTPVPIKLPGGPMSVRRRIAEVHELTEAARDEASRTGGMTGLSGVFNLLPTSVVTRAGRAGASHIDFATSNLRGAPFELYCAGAKVLGTVPMGPVAGTGANITALSHDGNFDIGMFMDPEAIEEPAAFKRYVEEAFADMAAATNPARAEKAKSKKKSGKSKTKKKSKSKKEVDA